MRDTDGDARVERENGVSQKGQRNISLQAGLQLELDV